jgi:hypothetical protein
VELQSLKEALADWTDIDVAQYAVAICLGLMSPNVPFPPGVKGVFWTNDPIGELLYHILENLTGANILEKRDEPDYQYRWNADFRGSWE